MGAYLPLPYVYEREGRQERAWDIYSRLLRDRIVFIGTPIDDYVANSIIAQLLFLQMEDLYLQVLFLIFFFSHLIYRLRIFYLGFFGFYIFSYILFRPR